MDHLEQVQRTGLTTFRDNAIFPDDSELLKVILAFHDLGKGSAHFQDYLLKNGPRSNLTRHSEISALWRVITVFSP
jgi:CRISPR/Cas system-associated endonuclease Cas3-HD